jgi:uncharacterized protein (DUF169 family)
MRALQTDLSIYSKFNFDRPPVGIKFLFFKPEGIEQLDKTLPFCEMFKEAQQRESPFYITKENEDCFGKFALGMDVWPAWTESGQLGPKYEIFQEARANNKIYAHIPKFERGVVNYVAYCRWDKLTFEPDILIITATPSQAEIVLRAMSYSTGELRESKSTSVLGCTWLFVYPYQSGKVNYTITGLTFGTKAKEIFEEGWILISIPYCWIPTITQNLQEMKWVLPSYTDGREKFIKREQSYIEELSQMSQNP